MNGPGYQTPLRRERRLVALVLCLGLLHGLLYLLLVPPWQHYDEPNHFEYVWLVANRGSLPAPGDFDLDMRRQVAESMVAHEFFAGLGSPPEPASEGAPAWIGTYSQLSEAPLYYLLAAGPVWLLGDQPVEWQLYGARLVSLGLYLVTLAAAYGMAAEVTAMGHPLRWLFPLGVAAVPAFTDLMTAVNNDVGAVAAFSLFVWAGTRSLHRGLSVPLYLGIMATVAACLLTKTTVYVALPLGVLAVIPGLVWGRTRRRVWLGLAAAALLSVPLLVGSGDATFWHRAAAQAGPLRASRPDAPVGEHVLQVQLPAAVSPAWLAPLSQPLPLPEWPVVAGRRVTLGAWMWASRPMRVRMPALHTPDQTYAREVEIGTAPAFHALEAAVPPDAGRLWVTLEPHLEASPAAATVYYDGLVLARGRRPLDGPPEFTGPDGRGGRWGDRPFTNLLRNPSAEAGWPRFRPWADALGARVLPDGTLPTSLFHSALDPDGTGWYYRLAARSLFEHFWARFAWGQVGLTGRLPILLLAGYTLLGLLGAGMAVIQRRSVLMWDGLIWWLLIVWGVWSAALMRGATYIFVPRVFIPVARYAYPAVLPTVLLLTAGWFELLRQVRVPERLRGPALVFAWLLLDAAALAEVVNYFYGR